MSRQPMVVVGVSGSSASAVALRWAVGEARRRHATLRVVRSWETEPRAPYAFAASSPTAAEQLADDDENLATMLRAVFGPQLPADVCIELVRGTAERVLISQSADADLLILGSSPSALEGGCIGTVIRACLHRAQCPVVVVGARRHTEIAVSGPEPDEQTVVTGAVPLRELVSA